MTTLETDPHGTEQHDAGAKMDEGKNRLSMVLGGFKYALIEVGRVGTFGANKYSDYGWLSVPDGYNRYSDALLRHFFTDEEIDDDSGMLHDAQVAWNALARLEFKLRERHGQRTGEVEGIEETQEKCNSDSAASPSLWTEEKTQQVYD